jgi:hypothetical protein
MIKITALSAAAAASVALAACGGSSAHGTATRSASSPSAAAAVSSVCPEMMGGVHDVARAMKINLTTGSAKFTFTRVNAVTWLGDLTSHLTGSMWANPSPATRRLHHDLNSAMFAMASIRDHATAATFIRDLQALAADCGRP